MNKFYPQCDLINLKTQMLKTTKNFKQKILYVWKADSPYIIEGLRVKTFKDCL